MFPFFILQVDPDLARTVLVSTKLDTKILQFARASDVEVFLHPPTCVLDGSLLGDYPFFTSVPSGRVGSCHEAVFRSNEEFKKVRHHVPVSLNIEIYVLPKCSNNFLLLASLMGVTLLSHCEFCKQCVGKPIGHLVLFAVNFLHYQGRLPDY